MNFFGDEDCFRKTYCCFPRVYATGLNVPALGNDATINQVSLPLVGTTPGQPVDRQADWIKVSSGGRVCFGIMSDGSLWGWGDPWQGYASPFVAGATLGDGTLDAKSIPILIDRGPWKHVSCCQTHTVAIKQDGTLWAWGRSSGVGLPAGSPTQLPVVRAVMSSPIGGFIIPQSDLGGYRKRPSAVVQYAQGGAGPGSGAAVDFDMEFKVTGVSVLSGGYGYTSAPIVLADGEPHPAFSAIMDYRVETIRVDRPGSGYINGATIMPIRGLRDVDATAEVEEYTYVTAGGVTRIDGIASIRVISKGRGYRGTPSSQDVQIVGVCSSPAVATPIYGDGFVSKVLINGSETGEAVGFASIPAISFSEGSPTAHASALIDGFVGKVTNLRVASGGSGYTTSSDQTLVVALYKEQSDSGTAPSVRQVPLTLEPSSISSLEIVSGGSGFPADSPPTYYTIFSGGDGSGARGTVEIQGGAATSANLLNPGGGYTSAPSVTVTPFPPWPVQISSDTWIDAVAAGSASSNFFRESRSAGITTGGSLYWWGDVAGGVLPHLVGKRVVVNGDANTLFAIESISPPQSPGLPAVAYEQSQVWPYPKSQWWEEGWPLTQDILFSGGVGYTSAPTITGGNAQATLVGPDQCVSVLANGSKLYAVDSGGALWMLGGERYREGGPNKPVEIEYASERTVIHPSSSDEASGVTNPGSVTETKEKITGTQAPTKFNVILKNGGSGYAGETATIWCKGQKTRHVWLRESILRTDLNDVPTLSGSAKTKSTQTVASDQTSTAPDYQVGTCTLWMGEVIRPAEVTCGHVSSEATPPDMSDATPGLGQASVSSITIDDEGAGYTSTPLVTIQGGAKAVATMIGGKITAITVTDPGKGYNGVPSVSITGGFPGNGFFLPPGARVAKATANMTGSFAPPNPVVQYWKHSFPVDAGQFEVRGNGGSGSGAVYEIAPPKANTNPYTFRPGSFHVGPVKVSGASWTSVDPPTGLSSSGELYFSVPHSSQVPGIKYPAPVQAPAIGISKQTVIRSDQSFWTYGGYLYDLNGAVLLPDIPSNNGNLEISIADAGGGYTVPATARLLPQGGEVAVAAPQLDGQVVAVCAIFGGSGYRFPPTISLSGGGGSGAQYEAVIAGPLESVGVVSGGGGYHAAPKAVFSKPGISASASVSVAGSVESVEVVFGGCGYTTTPIVSLVGGGGTGATATATLLNTGVYSVSVTNGGTGYTSPPSVIFSGPSQGSTGFEPASALARLSLSVNSVSVKSGGRYRASPTVTFAPDKTVESISLSNGGSGYSSPPTVVIDGERGGGAAAVSKINASVVEISVDSQGSGYSSAPAVDIVGGYDASTGAKATATATVFDGRVVSVSVTGGGSGYRSRPTVVFTGGGGAGASATARIEGAVSGVVIENHGSGYKDTPRVFFVGGGGSGAEADAVVGQVGTGASANCKINGSVICTKKISYGSGYQTPPVVTVTGGGNDRIDSLVQQLLQGTITQDQFNSSMEDLQAVAQARVAGVVSGVTVSSGGSGYSLQDDSGANWTSRYGYSRHGGKLNPSPEYFGQTTAGWALFDASAAVSGGAVQSVSLPGDRLYGETSSISTTWVRPPEILFSNTKRLRCRTKLKHAGGAVDDGRVGLALTQPGFRAYTLDESEDESASGIFKTFTTGHGARAVSPRWYFVYRFSEPPSVDIQGETGSGAEAVIELDQSGLPVPLDAFQKVVKTVSEGEGYGGHCISVFSGGRPLITMPVAEAVVSNGRVVAIYVTSPGSGFTKPPRVIIHGGGGSGALAVAPLAEGSGFRYGQSAQAGVAAVIVTESGSGYSSTPEVSFVPDEPDFCDHPSVRSPSLSSDWGFVDLANTPASRVEYLAVRGNAGDRYVEIESLPDSTSGVHYFFTDGYITKLWQSSTVVPPEIDNGYILAQSHWYYSQPPSVVFGGECKTPASASVSLAKWSTTVSSNDWNTLAVRDLT